MADQLKAQGNAAFAAKDFAKAVDFFTQAIAVDGTNHVLYSNRSASQASLRNFAEALKDADKCIEISPSWAKGYSRKGAALHGLHDLPAARDAYAKALELEPTNAQAKSGLQQVEAALEQSSAGGAQDMFAGIAQKLRDPALLGRIASNPSTSRLLADQDFMSKLARIQQNPQMLMQEINDPRIQSIFGLLFDLPEEMGKGDAEMKDVPSEKEEPAKEEEPAPKPKAEPQPAPEPEPEPEPEPDEKKQADAEKQLGTAAYKKRDFPTAIAHYSRAWELHKDITYLNNLAAAYFEAGDYDACIKEALKAVEEGREMHADYKLIAKAFGRIGTAYQRKGELEQALEYFQKSLTEHRTPDVLNKLKETEKLKTERDREAYKDPAKAEEARIQGNDLFKAADFVGAIRAYTEMTKRAPEDARGFANRAAAYIKMMSMHEALQDCDKAIELDPKFVKAYIRKAQVYFAMKEFSKCLDACTAATQSDTDGKHAREIDQQMQKCYQTMYASHSNETEEETMARIRNDPEITGILADPVMQSILSQARDDPMALQEHMKNPQVRSNIQKLMAAGVIRTR